MDIGGRCILIALFFETFFRDEVVIRVAKMSKAYEIAFMLIDECSGLMKPDTHLGENARQIEVSDDQTTPFLFC